MTAKQVYGALQIELNKENAPNILLEQFNYLVNKAIALWINKRYNIYDVNQQTTDDLRVLKSTAILDPTKVTTLYDDINTLMGATYEAVLPSDYLHILNCICIYNVKKTYACYDANTLWRRPATRLTADAFSLVVDNFYLRPDYKRPYYYIHNVNTQTTLPTNPYNSNTNKGTDIGVTTTTTKTELSNYLVTDGDEPDTHLEYNSFNTFVSLFYNLVIDATSPVFEFNGEKISKIDFTIEYKQSELSLHLYETFLLTTTFKKVSEDAYNFMYGWLQENPSHSIESIAIYFEDPFGENVEGTVKLYDEVTTTTKTEFPRSINIGNTPVSTVERVEGIRYGNTSEVRIEIRYGSDDIFELKKLYIDYIKTPQHIRLTQTEIDKTEDTSQILEYPDYVCQEIINELVKIVMENISDLRIQTFPIVNLSIANPTQALTPEAAGQSA